MILKLPIISFCVLTAIVSRSTAASLGEEATASHKSDTEELEQNIKDVFGSTAAPHQQSNTDLEQYIKDIFEGPSTAAPDLQSKNQSIPGVESCTCVPYYLCSNHGSNNKNDEGIIDISVTNNSCESFLEVCCKKKDQSETPIESLQVKRQTGCGFRHLDGVGFSRYNDDKSNYAEFGEFPWMVAVLSAKVEERSSIELNVYQCGGALIHPQIVLTAAHCVSGKNNSFKVRAGEWDTQNILELLPHQEGEVQNIIVHPQYNVKTLYNNVAVLHLREPLEISDNVDTVCLPPQGTGADSAACYATGWGRDNFGQIGKYQVILKKVDLAVVSNVECQTQLRTTRLGKLFELHESFMCASSGTEIDTCIGDEGSPLICPIPGTTDRYYQYGIVAWSIGCGKASTPGVYVNLSFFREWIDTQMKIFELDTSTYQY